MQTRYKSDFVNVVARVRPNLDKQETEGCLQITADPPAIAIHERQQQYLFDRVFNQDVDQETIYENTVKHLVDKLMIGHDCTAFAYGQTGSGKTYTMGTASSNLGSENERGIIIRTIYDIMTRLNENVETNIKVSFYEIYNEKVFDLLCDNQEIPLKVTGFKICNLTKNPIKSFHDGYMYLHQGGEKRHKGGTKQNATSSRSHAIFTIYVNVKNENSEFEGKLNLVDLAGSECVRRTGTEGLQFQEGVNINLGLLSIGQVISALSKATNNNHIPYRESIITTVLKDSLNRDNYITLIACVSANTLDVCDTIQTLDFAQRAKMLRNKPERNKPSKTPSRRLLSSIIKAPLPESTLPNRTPMKRPLPFTTSTFFNSNSKHRPISTNYPSTPSLHPIRSKIKASTSVNVNSLSDNCFVPPKCIKTTVSSLNVNNSVIPLWSTFMSDDNSIVSDNGNAASVVSSRLDATRLSPVIREYMETIHNEVMAKLDDVIQEKLNVLSELNLTAAQMTKIREVLHVTSETKIHSSPKNVCAVESEECSVPIQYSTFVENLTTPNRSKRTNLQHLFDSPQNSDNVQNDTGVFKIPKPMPRKRKLLSAFDDTNAEEDNLRVFPLKRRQSVRLQEKKIELEKSLLNDSININDKSRNSTNFKEKKSQIPNTRRSVRLLKKVRKENPVSNKIKSKSNKAPIPAPRRIDVANTKDNYNRILNILNYGSAKDLAELSSIGLKTAKQIYLYRSIKGTVNKISDLAGMPWKGNSYQRFLEANFLDCEV